MRGTFAERMPKGRARTRAGRRPPTGLSITVNLAPMIDMTFLLLIFFLVTTTFERAEGLLSARFPPTRGAAAVDLPLTPIVIRLAKTGPGHEEFSITIDYFDVLPANFEELSAALREIQQKPGFDTETPVVIVAGDDVPWDHVVGCWNAALRASCRKVAFAAS